jgi:uncharacterized protein involved in response to NO
MAPVYWHAHEMIVGFAMATIAGFTLSAVATWTGRPAVNGLPVLWLVVTWLLGRIAMVCSQALAPIAVISLDMLFPLSLCYLLAREIIVARSARNYKVVAIVFALAGFNLLFHLGPAREALQLLVHTILLLVALIGGRIIPNFTANWLRGQGAKRLPKSNPTIDRIALTLSVFAGVFAALLPDHFLVAALLLLTATVHGIRVSQWHGMQTYRNPLLFVLHLAYWWLPVGYAMLGLAYLGIVFPPGAALHALTMGSIGTFVFAMLTRVPLGHTGRSLQASRLTVFAYAIFTLAVVARILASIWPVAFMALLYLSAAAWCLAFAAFTWVYWSLLTRPSVGGD